jgi:S1-C subfamily serine protease
VLVIPAATLERVASALERHGRISRGYLGLGMHPLVD